MRARRSIAAGLLTAAAFTTTVGAFAITGSLDKAFASSPVSPPVSKPQNPGQSGTGQNPSQSGTGQNPGQSGQNTTTTTPPPLNSEVSGPFNGTNIINTTACSGGISQTFDATYTTTTGTGSFSMDGCNNVSPPDDLTFDGSFTLTAPDGATLQGGATGTGTAVELIGDVGTENFTLVPTSGTMEFANVTGVINLSSQFTLPGAVGSGSTGPFSGSLSGALT